jgi:uncharacterized protein
MINNYWPFWATGPALAAITVGFWILLRRPLGVSGVLARFSRVREEAAVDRGFEVIQSDPAALEAAMAAMTAEAFGLEHDLEPFALEGPESPDQLPTATASSSRYAPAGRSCAPTPPLGAHAVFLAALVAGGLLASIMRGSFGVTAGMGESFSRLVVSGPAGLGALAAGGVLVGFGTALCGGCTAGHGLTGCGRFMPGSLVSTATFLATAVGVSFLLSGVAS